MADKRLEAILERFASALARCSSGGEVRQLLLDFNQAAGFTGRYDQATVAMVDGIVVSAPVWQACRDRFEALRERLSERGFELARKEQQALRARHLTTLRLFFDARLEDPDTEELLRDPEALSACHGAREATHLKSSLNLTGTPVLPLPVDATLAFDAATGNLKVALDLALEQKPMPEQIRTICKRVSDALLSGWGLNYQFELPEQLDDYVLHFERHASSWEIADIRPPRA